MSYARLSGPSRALWNRPDKSQSQVFFSSPLVKGLICASVLLQPHNISEVQLITEDASSDSTSLSCLSRSKARCRSKIRHSSDSTASFKKCGKKSKGRKNTKFFATQLKSAMVANMIKQQDTTSSQHSLPSSNQKGKLVGGGGDVDEYEYTERRPLISAPTDLEAGTFDTEAYDTGKWGIRKRLAVGTGVLLLGTGLLALHHYNQGASNPDVVTTAPTASNDVEMMQKLMDLPQYSEQLNIPSVEELQKKALKASCHAIVKHVARNAVSNVKSCFGY